MANEKGGESIGTPQKTHRQEGGGGVRGKNGRSVGEREGKGYTVGSPTLTGETQEKNIKKQLNEKKEQNMTKLPPKERCRCSHKKTPGADRNRVCNSSTMS